MTLAAAKGTFTTATGLNRQELPGIGFRPTAILAWWACQPRAGHARGNRGGIGFWVAEESAAMTWASGDDESSSRTAQLAESAALLGLDRTGTEVTLRAFVDSFREDGLTLRYATSPSECWIVHFLALGPPAAEARIGWTSPARGRTARPEARSGLTFLAHVPAGSAAVARDLAIGFGACGDEGVASAGYLSRDGQVPGEPIGAQRSDAATLPWPHELSSGSRHCYLHVDGLHAKVGTDVSPARSGARHTRVGFRPEALVLFSWGLSPSPNWKTMGRLCLGGASADGAGCIGWVDRDGFPRETMTHVWSSTDHALVVVDSRTGELHAHAALSSLDQRGFTLDWESDGKHRQFAYVALTGCDPRGRVRRGFERLRRLWPA